MAIILDVLYNPMFPMYGLIACIMILLGLVLHLEIRLNRMKFGKNSQSLEDSLQAIRTDLEKLNAFQKAAIGHLENVEGRLNRSIQAVETIRFNPFKGVGEGGNQSFSTAFVSEKGKGVVISSLYSRDRVSVFSKPLEKFESTFELTGEEKEVLTAAKKNLG